MGKGGDNDLLSNLVASSVQSATVSDDDDEPSSILAEIKSVSSSTEDGSSRSNSSTETTDTQMILHPPTDFIWETTDEPHASRRKRILQKYPEIKQLYGVDELLKYKIAAIVLLQLILAYTFRNQFTSTTTTTTTENNKYPAWVFWLVGYVVGGTANHACFMAMHELSHNLGFKKKYWHLNRYYAMFANIPTVVPSAVAFKRYHMDHHKYQGVDGIDVDVPTATEGRYICNAYTKFLFLFFQVAFYSLRPAIVNMKQPGRAEIINWIVVIGSDLCIWNMWGFPALFYLMVSSFFAAGLHPVAGHFIAEHYVFPNTHNQETYSYYGILNLFTFNVGYHNEHHDFPFVPGSRLPLVRQIAAEFYDDLVVHTSYCRVIYEYIFNPEITAFSRVKRRRRTTADDTHGVVADVDEQQQHVTNDSSNSKTGGSAVKKSKVQ